MGIGATGRWNGSGNRKISWGVGIMRNQKEYGYTLTELAVVLAIIGLVFQFSTAGFAQYQNRTALERAAQQLAGDIVWLRHNSASSKKNLSIRVNPGTQYPYYVLLDNLSVIKREYYPDGIYSNFNNFAAAGGFSNQFIFATTGLAYRPNLGGHIALTDGHGNFRYIIISQNGRVRISKSPPGGFE